MGVYEAFFEVLFMKHLRSLKSDGNKQTTSHGEKARGAIPIGLASSQVHIMDQS
jgi:hypothetical protein